MKSKSLLALAILGIILVSGCVQQEGIIKAELDKPFQLKINQEAFISSENIKVKFLEVTEDSRCSAGARCLPAEGGNGVTIKINIQKGDQNLGDFSLAIKGGDGSVAIKDFDTYFIKLTDVEPPQEFGRKIVESDYKVTLTVSKLTLGGKEISFETIESGAHSAHSEKNNYVINTGNDWANLWTMMGKTTSPLEVDFAQNTVIAVFLGSHSTGGYGIQIVKIVENPRVMEILVKEISPGPECDVTQAFTQPYHIVKIQKTDKEIIFKTTEEITKCGKMATGWQG